MHPRPLLRWLEIMLLCLLFVAHGLVHFIIPAVLPSWPEIAGCLHDSVLFAQLTLLLFWLMYGPGRLVWRIPCGCALMGISFWMGGVTFAVVAGKYFGALLLAYAAAVLIAAVVARLFGWRLARADLERSLVRQFRFGVRSLLALFFVSAIGVWLGQRIHSYVLSESIVVPAWLGVVCVAAPMTFIALAAPWALLKRGAYWARALAFATIVPGIGVLAPLVCAREGDLDIFVLWSIGHALVLGSSLLVVRAGGYRLDRSAVGIASASSAATLPVPASTAAVNETSRGFGLSTNS